MFGIDDALIIAAGTTILEGAGGAAVVAEGVAATATVAEGIAATAAIAEGVAATTAVAEGIAATAAIAEGVAATTAVAEGIAATAAIAEGVTATTAVAEGIAATAAIAEGVTATTAVAEGIAATTAIAEGVTATTAVAEGIATTATVAEGIAATTTVAEDIAITTTVAEDIAATATTVEGIGTANIVATTTEVVETTVDGTSFVANAVEGFSTAANETILPVSNNTSLELGNLTGEGVNRIIENHLSDLIELSEPQSNYLAELDVPVETWDNLSGVEKNELLDNIRDRMSEMGVAQKGTNLETVFGEHIRTSLESHETLERINPSSQIVSLEEYEKFAESPENLKELILGREKDANVLRENMRIVQEKCGTIDTRIERSNSRAHHIVGDNPSSLEAEEILKKHAIDINDPMNGVFLPNDTSSPLKGVIHEGRHTSEYHDIVNQRLRIAQTREDCLEILDSIKEDLINGDLPLYKNHVVNY